MRILIAGAQGMLGTYLAAEFQERHSVAALSHAQLDITNPEQCRSRMDEVRPEVVINAAAMTHVDECETEQEKAFRINAEGPGLLAAAAADCRALFAHYSSDYVFDGSKKAPYSEEDPTNPQSVYGRSKLEGERRVQAAAQNHLILRTSWVFGKNGRNFISTIVTAARQGRPLRVVDDQQGSPTYARDLAQLTLKLVEARCRGTYHATNSDSCTCYELACRAVEWAGLRETQVIPVTTAEYSLPASRPAYSVLGNFKLEREGFRPMRSWRSAAEEYVRECLFQK